MYKLLFFPMFIGLALALIGCGGPDTETAVPPEPEETAETREAPRRDEPVDRELEALTEGPTTEHEATVEVREEHDGVILDDDREEVNWWDDDELAESLGLEPEQRTRLLEAREALLDARMEGRARMDQQRDLEPQAEGDADRLAELRESAGLIQQEMDEAEQLWQDTVITTLRPEQLEQIRDLIEP